MTPKIADLLTAYRLAAAPVAAIMALTGHRDAFFILIIISMASDLIDGPIARWLKQESEFGARLDTVADGSTILAGLLGLYIFEIETLRPELPWAWAFLASYGAAALACLAKFARLPSYHLYLSKIAASAAGLFVAVLYLVGYSRGFFITVLCLGILANIESVLATLRLQRFSSDIASVFRLGAGKSGKDV